MGVCAANLRRPFRYSRILGPDLFIQIELSEKSYYIVELSENELYCSLERKVSMFSLDNPVSMCRAFDPYHLLVLLGSGYFWNGLNAICCDGFSSISYGDMMIDNKVQNYTLD